MIGRMRRTTKSRTILFSVGILMILTTLTTVGLTDAALAHGKSKASATGEGAGVATAKEKLRVENGPTETLGRLRMPRMDPERGKQLFVTKGCVACHAVNGVGGHDAPALDAHTMDPEMNPFDFAAKMWRSALGMIAMQEEAFGEQLTFTGDELADIAAFVHNDGVQHTFSERDLTPQARKMMDHSHGGPDMPAGHADDDGDHGHPAGGHMH